MPGSTANEQGLHITSLPLASVGMQHCVGMISNTLGGLVFRETLPACRMAEVSLGQCCRALHAWFSTRFVGADLELPPSRGPAPALRPPPPSDIPGCEMYLDAESLNHVTGASVRCWRGGSDLLGCMASRDSGRRVFLVTDCGDSFLISDLEARTGARPGDRMLAPQYPWHSC